MSFVINPYRLAAGGGTFGNASRDFDGTNDYISTANFDTTLDSSFTIAFWLKLDDGQPATNNQFCGVDIGTDIARILLTTGGLFRAVYRSNGNTSVAASANSLANGQQAWIHLAWVITPTGQKIYVDGSEATLDATNDGDMTGVTMGDFSTSLNFYIGARNINGSADQFTAGNYADFRIYDADIGATEIANLAAGTDYTTNLQGRWLGNDDNLLDLSGNSLDGYGLAPLPDNATFGDGSRFFDGVDDFMNVASSNASFNFVHDTKVFSVACWVRLEDHTRSSEAQVIVGTSLNVNFVGWSAYYTNDTATKAFVFLVSDGDASGLEVSFTVENQIDANGEWHHVCWTCDASTLRFYLDGSQVDTASVSATSYGDATNDLRIGRQPATSLSELKGYLADLRIYDDELTSGEIADLIAGTNVAGNLKSHYFLNTDSLADSGSLNLTGSAGGGSVFNSADAGTFDTDGPLD